MIHSHERIALKLLLLKSSIFSKHHYFISHFRPLKNHLSESKFLKAFLDNLLCIENKIPGFSADFITSFASISGKEKFEPHYEQLVQMLAELVIIGRLAYIFSHSRYSFVWEPTAGDSKKNPEISIKSDDWLLLVEVKCPSFLNHTRVAASNSIQLGARIGELDFFNSMSNTGMATKPLDNKIKDYLISANEKFSTFKTADRSTHTILILVWTQHRYEAISPMMNGMCGLFTDSSYLKNDDGTPVEFKNIDGVIVTSHYDVILHGSRDEALPPGHSNPLDFGNVFDPNYSHPVYIQNPASSNAKATALLDGIKAIDYVESGGNPLTSAMDMIFWLRRSG